jgi:hypothetical protein
MTVLKLSPEKIAPTVQDSIAAFHRSTEEGVARAVEKDRVVVVGMAQNPFVEATG